MELSAIILAGGTGRRMGMRNKALLKWGAETFIRRQIQECRKITDEIVVVSNDESFCAQLRSGEGVVAVPDRIPGEGPLAGLDAGFFAVSRPNVWLVACDQPMASADAALCLFRRMCREQTDAAIPELEGRLQPLHAIYGKHAAEMAAQLLRQGERRMRALLDRIRWSKVDDAEFLRLGIATSFAQDVDTPADYERLCRHPAPDIMERIMDATQERGDGDD
jgi:molybdopterin-guanine dinucleotide biosynthesis protein A